MASSFKWRVFDHGDYYTIKRKVWWGWRLEYQYLQTMAQVKHHLEVLELHARPPILVLEKTTLEN